MTSANRPVLESSELLGAMNHYPSFDIMLSTKTIRAFAFITGFFLQCNIITSSLGLPFLHITDALVVAGSPVLLMMCMSHLTKSSGWLLILFLCICLALTLLGFFQRGPGDAYTTILTFFYTVFMISFVYVLFRCDQLESFLWGLVIGASAAILLLHADAEMGRTLQRYGLSYPFNSELAKIKAQVLDNPSILQRLQKAGGIWDRGNEAGPTFGLASAAAAHLSLFYKRPRIFLVFLIIYLSSFPLTLNRSGLFAVLSVFALLILRSRRVIALLVAAFGIATLIIILNVSGVLTSLGFLEALNTRFIEDSGAGQNISERVLSTLAGANLAFQYPLGIGFSARANELLQAVGLRTPHNGFLATAYMSGLPFAVLAFASVIYVILHGCRINFVYFSAFCLLISYSFEELNYNPVFMAYVGIIIGYTHLSLDYRVFTGRLIRRIYYRGAEIVPDIDYKFTPGRHS